jgi:hypothetical protein
LGNGSVGEHTKNGSSPNCAEQMTSHKPRKIELIIWGIAVIPLFMLMMIAFGYGLEQLMMQAIETHH